MSAASGTHLCRKFPQHKVDFCVAWTKRSRHVFWDSADDVDDENIKTHHHPLRLYALRSS